MTYNLLQFGLSSFRGGILVRFLAIHQRTGKKLYKKMGIIFEKIEVIKTHAPKSILANEK